MNFRSHMLKTLVVKKKKLCFLAVGSITEEDTENCWNDNRGFRMFQKLSWLGSGRVRDEYVQLRKSSAETKRLSNSIADCRENSSWKEWPTNPMADSIVLF